MSNPVPPDDGSGGGGEQKKQPEPLKAELHGTITIAQPAERHAGDNHGNINNRRDRPFFHRFSVIGELLIGLALVVVGGFQVGLLFRQAHIMKTQTQLIGEQNGLTAAIQRAFVVLAGFQQELITDDAGNRVAVRYTPIIKNTGNTPATNVSLVTVPPLFNQIFQWYEGGDPNSPPIWDRVKAPIDPYDILIKRPLSSKGRIIENTYLGPGAIVPLNSTIDGGEVDIRVSTYATKAGEEKPRAPSPAPHYRPSHFIYGSIKYTDAFKTEHVSKFCYDLSGVAILDSLTKTTIEPMPTLCSHWNCMDADCDKDKAAYEADMKAARVEPWPPKPPRAP